MKSLLPHRRTLAVIMLSAFLAASLAPAAEAGHAYGRRWKSGPPVREVRYSQPYYGTQYRIVHHSDAGPILAGIVGGLVLGAALSHAQPVIHEEYAYVDPYCDQEFRSFDDCESYIYYHHHPRIVRVIEVSSGNCVRTMHWANGGWCSGDGDWDR
jgi:hypothetical protein